MSVDLPKNCMYVVDNDGKYLLTEDDRFVVLFCFPAVKVRLVNGKYQPCKQCRHYRNCIIPQYKRLPNINMKLRRHTQHFPDVYECIDYTPRKFDWDSV